MKPRVLLKCVANTYTGPNERIIEFSGGKYLPAGHRPGGLIAFRELDDGRLVVNVYRCDPEVIVHCERSNAPCDPCAQSTYQQSSGQ